jgi:hypothetical protein
MKLKRRQTPLSTTNKSTYQTTDEDEPFRRIGLVYYRSRSGKRKQQLRINTEDDPVLLEHMTNLERTATEQTDQPSHGQLRSH